jgi:hypothetical protein
MNHYQIQTGDSILGRYEAPSSLDAVEQCAYDRGYESIGALYRAISLGIEVVLLDTYQVDSDMMGDYWLGPIDEFVEMLNEELQARGLLLYATPVELADNPKNLDMPNDPWFAALDRFLAKSTFDSWEL